MSVGVLRRSVASGLITFALTGAASAQKPEWWTDKAVERRTKAIADLVAGNRILDSQGVIDVFGHISCRSPDRADRFFMSRARSPALIEPSDIIEFDLAGMPIDDHGRTLYSERFIHAAIYSARVDVRSVVHDHSRPVIPFGVTDVPLRPLAVYDGALGDPVPVWDIRDHFGDNVSGQVSTLQIGVDLASKLGRGSTILMRGHGAVVAGPSIRVAVFLAISLSLAAETEEAALLLRQPIKGLSPGESTAAGKLLKPEAGELARSALGRSWEYWCKKANVPYVENGF